MTRSKISRIAFSDVFIDAEINTSCFIDKSDMTLRV